VSFALWMLFYFVGLGLGLMYLPSIVVVSCYFEKRRSLAIGLSLCGAGVGTFVFAPLTQLLIDEYGWRGAILIEAGILLNGLVCGAILRPLTVPVAYHLAFDSSRLQDSVTSELSPQFMSPVLKQRSRVAVESTSVGIDNSLEQTSTVAKIDSPSSQYLHTVKQQELYARNSLLNLTLSTCSLPVQLQASRTSTKKSRYVFCNAVFVLFIIATVLASVGFCVPYVFIPDRAIQLGQSEDHAAMLLSVIGISNTIGRIVFGYVSDFRCVNRLALFWISLVLCGMSSILSSYCQNFSSMVVYCSLMGLLMGEYVNFTAFYNVRYYSTNMMVNLMNYFDLMSFL